MISILHEWIMNMEHWWSGNDGEKPKRNYWERNLYQSILSPTLLTWSGLGLKPGFRLYLWQFSNPHGYFKLRLGEILITAIAASAVGGFFAMAYTLTVCKVKKCLFTDSKYVS